jgi:hypothetical protein
MKTAPLVMEKFTGWSFFATIVFGLWLRNSGEGIRERYMNFHIVIGLVTSSFAVITILLLSSR